MIPVLDMFLNASYTPQVNRNLRTAITLLYSHREDLHDEILLDTLPDGSVLKNNAVDVFRLTVTDLMIDTLQNAGILIHPTASDYEILPVLSTVCGLEYSDILNDIQAICNSGEPDLEQFTDIVSLYTGIPATNFMDVIDEVSETTMQTIRSMQPTEELDLDPAIWSQLIAIDKNSPGKTLYRAGIATELSYQFYASLQPLDPLDKSYVKSLYSLCVLVSPDKPMDLAISQLNKDHTGAELNKHLATLDQLKHQLRSNSNG